MPVPISGAEKADQFPEDRFRVPGRYRYGELFGAAAIVKNRLIIAPKKVALLYDLSRQPVLRKKLR